MTANKRTDLLLGSVLSTRAPLLRHLPNRPRWATSISLFPALAIAASLAVAAPDAYAGSGPVLPTEGVFAAGAGQIRQNGPASLEISQTSNRGIIDWGSFSIGEGGAVRIDNASGATLNRVLGGQLSRLDGQLTATGSIYLMNPNGVIIGSQGRIATGGSFVATTRQVDDAGFMSGGTVAISGKSDGDIINSGSILSEKGSVVMIARSVTNKGLITASQGRASLVAADDVLLGTTDGTANGIFVAVHSGGTGDVTQTGRVEAAAASLQSAGGNIFALAGNRDGLVKATGTEVIDGQLWLSAPRGKVEVGGTLAAQNVDGSGGKVKVEGRIVDVTSSAQIAATGTRGGEVVIGASSFGTGSDLAESTSIASGATILAGGSTSAGRIETSGLSMDIGEARIDPGNGGLWLLDPDDLTIDAALASTIVSSLDGGSNVTQQTTAGGAGGSGDITVAAAINWTGSGDLTLDAYRDITINQSISGGGDLTLTAGGAINVASSVSAATVTGTATTALTIASGGSIGSTGDVTLAAATFANQAGASAVTSSAGTWSILTDDPAGDSDGGLLPDFYQYDASGSPSPAAPGNGRYYRLAPTVSVSFGAITKSYDGTTDVTLDDSNATVTGLVNNEDWTLDGSYASKDVGTGIAITADNFQASDQGIDVYGYTVTPADLTTTGSITAADLSALIIGIPTKTYNGTTTVSLTSANFDLIGLAAGESITVNSVASAAYASPTAGNHTIDATLVSSSFTAGAGTSLSNYILPTTAAGLGRINQAELIVLGVTANSKVYDSTITATLNVGNASLYGVLSGDSVTLDTSGATGDFLNKDVGNDKVVIGNGFALSGADSANYTVGEYALLADPQGQLQVVGQIADLAANITPATIVATDLIANDKIYDGTNTASLNAAGMQLSGVIGDDDITVGGASAEIHFATKNAGTDIPVTVTGATLAGADAGNYILTYSGSLNADILQRQLTLGFNGTPTKVYDGTTTVLAGATPTVQNVVAGESVTVPQVAGVQYASKNVGTWDITANVTPADYQAGANTSLSNYILPTALTAQGDITPASLTISIVGNPTKGYDGNANASLGPSNFAVTGFVAGEGATVTETSGQYSSADAGIRTVSVDLDASDFDPDSGTLMSNYMIPSPVTGPGTITRIPLGPGVIIVDITGNPTKVYDGNTVATLTSSDYTLGGFIPGEGAIITETVGEYDSKDVGQRVVTVLLEPSDFTADPGTNLDNYTLPDQATGIGEITQKLLTASIINNPTKVYNATDLAILGGSNYEISGVVSGESVSVLFGSLVAYDDADAGNRTITAQFTADSNFLFGGNTLRQNYILPTVATGPGTITQAPLQVLGISAQNKVYDQTTAATIAGNASLFGIIDGDTVNLEGGSAVGVFDTPNVGNNINVSVSGYTIFGLDASNYQLTQPIVLSANITPLGIVLANASALDKPYDGTTVATLSLGGGDLTGVIAGDDVALNSSGGSAVFIQRNVGTNLTVTASGYSLSGAQAGNYSLSQPSGLFADITPLQLTGTIIGNPSKVYDATTSVALSAANYSLSGFIAGEGGSITQSAGASYDSPNAGARTITAQIVSSDIRANQGTTLSNYLVPSTATGPGTINPAQLVATIIGNPTKVYDSSTAATLTSTNYALSGFINGDGASVTEAVGAYETKNVGARIVTAMLDNGDFQPTGSTLLDNYILPVAAAGLGTITAATLQVIGVIANDKIYDGTVVATLDNIAADLDGLYAGDVVTVDASGASGTFATRNVGDDIDVTATGYAIAGADSGNYIVTQPTGLFADIFQATLQVASVTKVYDAGTSVPTVDSAYTLAGVFGSDDVSISAAAITGAYDDKNVGTGKNVNLNNVAITGVDAGNYFIDPAVVNQPIGTITPAELQIIGVDAEDRQYNALAIATLINSGAGLDGVLGSDDVILDVTNSSGLFVDAAGNPDPNVGVDKTVQTAGYTVSGGDVGNYTLVQPDYVTATITPLPIALASVSKVYDGLVTLPSDPDAYGFNGILGSDIVTADATGATGSYSNKDVGGSLVNGVVNAGINVSVSGLILTGPQGGNYSVGAVVDQPLGVITPKELAVSIIGNPTKVYDALTAATLGVSNYQIDGLVSGESATISQVDGEYDGPNAGPRNVTASLSASDFSGIDTNNYIVPTSASGPGQINQAELTISGVFAINKVYDGNTDAQLNSSGAVLNGIVPNEPNTISLNSSNATGQFAQSSVGTGIDVTASGYAVDGDTFSNYFLTQPTGLSADITQALLTITNVTRVYNGLVDLPTVSSAYTLSGMVLGDDVSVDAASISGSYADKNVNTGIGINAISVGLTGAQSANYSISPVLIDALIGEITPATLTIEIVGNPTKPYDGTAAATLLPANYQIDGFVSGEGGTITQSAGSYDTVNVGLQGVTANLDASDFALTGSTDLGNYLVPDVATGEGTITALTLTAAITGDPTKTYDGNNVATLTSTDYTLTGFIAGESATITQTLGTYSSPNAGTWTVSAGLGAGDFAADGATLLSNYILPIEAQGDGTINKAAVTASIVDNPTKPYDGTNTATLTATNFALSGFISGEGATVTQTTGNYATPNAGTQNVTALLGAGNLLATGATNFDNYDIPLVASGDGTITQLTLSAIVVNNPTKPYDGTDTANLVPTNYQLTGFIAGEGADVTQTVGAYDTPNAGSQNVTVNLVSGDFAAMGSTNLANYILPDQAQGTGTISQLTLIAAITGNPTKTYDGNNVATLTSTDYTLTGFVAGESATITQTLGTYASPNAGTWNVAATLGAGDFAAEGATLLSNYVLPVEAQGDGTINKIALNAAITGVPTKTYDATTTAMLASSNYNLTGFIAGEGATITETVGAYGSPDAGFRVVTAMLEAGDYLATGATNLDNYELPGQATGFGLILRAPLTASVIGNPTKPYDGNTIATLTSANYQLSGFVGGQSGTIIETQGVYGDQNVGLHAVTVGLGSADFVAGPDTLLTNYILPTQATGLGTITQAMLNAIIIGNPTKTYDGNSVAFLTSANYQLVGFVADEGATISQTVGAYDTANAAVQTITALLGIGDFTATGATNLANYALPTQAQGEGTINKAALSVSIINDPTKAYDGTVTAALAPNNYQLTGFITGEGAGITETVGAYAAANAGSRIVTATLGGEDYAPTGATNLANYDLPTQAIGLGTITQAILSAIIVNNPTKTYDGNDAAALTPSNYQILGFANGEGADVIETFGTYASADAGARLVTADLDSGDFAATGATDFSNYILPTQASGLGTIDKASLAVSIIGDPTKIFDGTIDATLTSINYDLTGFVGNETASITKTTGSYNLPSAGTRIVFTALAVGDYAAGAGTNLDNYVLPDFASGLGTILRRPLVAIAGASIINNPTKVYDGNNVATLTPENYEIEGFVPGDGATITQTQGSYANKNVGGHVVIALLAPTDFIADTGTDLDNYILPISADGPGTIIPATLSAAIIGNPTKVYDGNTGALLTSGNYQLTGFVAGEGANVTETAGAYDTANAGSRIVTAMLESADFAATGDTSLSNYILPTQATGAGTITQAQLNAAIVNDPTKVYDGNTTATLAAINYQLTGFVAGEGASITETTGTYSEKNVGARLVTAMLGASDYSATGATNLSNYVLPTQAIGDGAITPATLTAAIVQNPTKTYDGNTSISLAPTNYQLSGFAAGEGATVTETAGVFDDKNAGVRMVTADLASTDFSPASGTMLSNYILPTQAAGPGTINQAILTAAIVGNPTKLYDGTTLAHLTPDNYQLSGFIEGEGASVTQPVGNYSSPNSGRWTVTAQLTPADYVPDEGTQLSNYVLPTEAAGPGTIRAREGCLVSHTGGCFSQTRYIAAIRNPHFYIPYPVGGIYQGYTNALGALPSVVRYAEPQVADDGSEIIWSGLPIVNSTEIILSRGGGGKQWLIQNNLPKTVRFEGHP